MKQVNESSTTVKYFLNETC